MTVTEAAKLLAQHIAQGRGDWQFGAFQWGQGSEPVVDIIPGKGHKCWRCIPTTRNPNWMT